MSDLRSLKRLYRECLAEAKNATLYLAHEPKGIFYYNSKGECGCSTGSGYIFIDKALFKLLSDRENKDTIMHEICHIEVGPERGHGKTWRKKCEEIRETYPEYNLDHYGKIEYFLSLKADKLREKYIKENKLPELPDGVNYPD